VQGLEVYPTPEKAAAAGLPKDQTAAQLVGVVVRGDQAVVIHITDRAGVPRDDFDTRQCRRVAGGWIPGSGGNSDATFIVTDDETVTVVSWRDAPPGAKAARYLFLGCEQTFQVSDGHVVAVFDEIPFREFWPAGADFPPEMPYRVVEWIGCDG
jgi:hypothetical protein